MGYDEVITHLGEFVSGIVEIPGYVFVLLTVNRWGRRTILCGSMLTGGIALLLTLIVPGHMNWLIITFAMVGKLAITASLGTVYIFSVEQFPTVPRSVGMGAASTSARIGGILAPYLNLLSLIWRPLPLNICGVLTFTGGLLSLMLPETLNKPMPETVADGENFDKKIKQAVDEAGEEGEEMKNMLKNQNNKSNNISEA